MYAVKFSEPNIVLSSRVNENSRILYDRAPRERVQKVAPWLTVDGDAYPAVVDGRVKWILDGYTTTDHYPNSQKDSLRSMTSDALSPNTTYATLPTDEINYMRNSVKAVVDAYDGTVDLYEWDEKDPILKAWEGAFDNIVKSKASIPPDLKAHMRYPEDLFKVQRNMLAAYHVTNPKTFYDGSDKWKVPEDPENKANKQPPYRLSVQDALRRHRPVFSLTSVYVPNNRQNLASFISVDADASRKDYGTIRILRLPSNTQVPGPSQIANNFGQDPDIQDKLLAFSRNQLQGGLRQPAHAAGRRRAALRAAAVHPAQVRRGSLPGAALRAGLLRRAGRHRHDADGRPGRRTRHRVGAERHHRRLGRRHRWRLRWRRRRGPQRRPVPAAAGRVEVRRGAAGPAGRRPRGLRQGPGRGPRPGAAGTCGGQQGQRVGEPVALVVGQPVGVAQQLTGRLRGTRGD